MGQGRLVHAFCGWFLGTIAFGQNAAPPIVRPNQPLSANQDIQDLNEIAANSGASATRQPAPVNAPRLQPPVQVLETRLPGPDDGLAGNRQIALSPFPNLDLQSGPLATQQLPWYHHVPVDSPYSAWRTMDYQLLGGFCKSNGRDDVNPGWYNSLGVGLPFWTERGIGAQLGGALELNLYPTVYGYVTAGLFRQAIWPEEPRERIILSNRLSWGTVYDLLYDSEHRAFVGQSRTQLGFSLTEDRECGMWFTIPLQDHQTAIGAGVPLRLSASAQVAFYYRRTFASEVDTTWIVGADENPGGAFGGLYASYRFAERVSMFAAGQLGLDTDGPYSLYGGMVFHFQPLSTYALLAGNPENRYRPFLRIADHLQLTLRKRPL